MKWSWLISVIWLVFCSMSGAWLASQGHGYASLTFGILIGIHVEWINNQIKKRERIRNGKHE